MKEVWQQRALVNIADGHKEFLDDIERIASPTFKPVPRDVLLARAKTKRACVERYRFHDVDWELLDVGEQKSTRRKWLPCFDGVAGVIFVASLSEYDQTASNGASKKRTNKMVEALEQFRAICNSTAFDNTPVLLFLTKREVFWEKLEYSDIAAQTPFADYGGPPNDFDSGVSYFIEKFRDCGNRHKVIYFDVCTHVCNATDTANSKYGLFHIFTIDVYALHSFQSCSSNCIHFSHNSGIRTGQCDEYYCPNMHISRTTMYWQFDSQQHGSDAKSPRCGKTYSIFVRCKEIKLPL